MAIRNESLEQLAKSHVEAGVVLKYAASMIVYIQSPIKGNLCTQKQVFYYEYLNDYSRLAERSLNIAQVVTVHHEDVS